MDDSDKKLSFANTSRKHFFLRREKQQQWMELNYEAAKTLASELNADPDGYLSYSPANGHGCLLIKRAMQLRKDIDEKMDTRNYLVGKMRESEHHYSLFNEDVVLQDHLEIDIFHKYLEKIAQLYYPDIPQLEAIKHMVTQGFEREIPIGDTKYKIRLSKKYGSNEYDNIVLENPHWYENANLIKDATESLQKAYQARETHETVQNITAAKRDFIVATPYCSGTSSIADLVEKALFESKHIDYGSYYPNTVSRDVLAFICPDNATYQNEYLNVKIPVISEEKLHVSHHGMVHIPSPYIRQPQLPNR